MLDAVLSASRASIGPPTVAPADGGRIKPPKPTLQKLSKEDDIESYLDMFERVAKRAMDNSVGRTAVGSSRCIRIGPLGNGSQL